MKLFITTVTLVVGVAFCLPDALAQMLPPKHPGYSMDAATSPVTGQPLTNDPGQTEMYGDEAIAGAAASDVARSVQVLEFNLYDKRILTKSGAGVLPKVDGPDFKIEPPFKEATRMK